MSGLLFTLAQKRGADATWSLVQSHKLPNGGEVGHFLLGNQSGAGGFAEAFCKLDWHDAWTRADSLNRAEFMQYILFANALMMGEEA